MEGLLPWSHKNCVLALALTLVKPWYLHTQKEGVGPLDGLFRIFLVLAFTDLRTPAQRLSCK